VRAVPLYEPALGEPRDRERRDRGDVNPSVDRREVGNAESFHGGRANDELAADSRAWIGVGRRGPGTPHEPALGAAAASPARFRRRPRLPMSSVCAAASSAAALYSERGRAGRDNAARVVRVADAAISGPACAAPFAAADAIAVESSPSFRALMSRSVASSRSRAVTIFLNRTDGRAGELAERSSRRWCALKIVVR